MNKRGLAVLCGSIAATPLFSTSVRALTPVTENQPQLFLDDSGIQAMAGLVRTMHTPTKQGAVLAPDASAGETIIQTRSAPAWIPSENQYKMVYLSVYQGAWTPMIATSPDGLHWTRPNLGRPGVNPPNKVVVSPSNAQWADAQNVIYDPTDPNPARRYKALLGDINRLPGISADGANFNTVQITPITSGDESQLSYDPNRKLYIGSLKTFTSTGRSIGISTSGDFTHWTGVQTVFATDTTDQQQARQVIKQRVSDPGMMPLAFVDPEPPANYVPAPGTLSTWTNDVYNMSIIPYGNGYIGMPAIFYRTGLDAAKTNTDGFQQIQLVYSTDLQHWERLGNRAAFIAGSSIANGKLGVFDRTEILPPSAPVVHGDQLWFYYTGIKWRDSPYAYNADGSSRPMSQWTAAELADYNEGQGAVCLATLRKDGFFSLDAGSNSGSVVTAPISFGADRLFLNLAGAVNGSAKVEVVNDAGQALPGFGSGDVVPVTGDGVRIPVSWKTGSIDSLAGQSIHLRITLQNASIYSYQAIPLPEPTTLNLGADQMLGNMTLDLGNHTVNVGRDSIGANVHATMTLGGLFVTGGGSSLLQATLAGNTAKVTGNLFVEQSTKLVKTGPGLLLAGSVNAQGTLDITNGDMAVDYTGASPAAAIRSSIISGYNQGKWDGFGITSSSAASVAAAVNNIHKTVIGYGEASVLGISSLDGQTVDSSTILIRYTFLGDANLDGHVNTLDFTALAGHFNSSGAQWIEGDFNYDGIVNALDFSGLATNFGLTLATDAPREDGSTNSTTVPEPVVVAMTACTLLLAHGRRRVRTVER